MVRSFGGAASTLHSSITLRHIAMSHFYSLDDDEGGTAGPSDHGSQVQSGLSSLSPPSSRSGAESRGNPIYAMLDGETASRVDGDDGDANGMRVSDAGDAHGKRRSEPPIMHLQRAWVAERAAPEILAWEGDAVDDVCSQIEEQMTIVESLASDTSTAEEEHVRLGLVELDVERARWLLKSYLRCRLDKIEQHVAFLQQHRPSKERMSDLEKGYCVKFAKLQSKHYQNAVLDFLPANLRSLEDKSESGTDGRGDMVTQPDLHRPVFVRCLDDCGSFTFRGHDELVSFSKGSIHFVRYSAVRQLIERRQLEIL